MYVIYIYGNIYIHLPSIYPSHVSIYTSTMEHMGERCDVVPSWPILTRSEVCPENDEGAEPTGDAGDG